MYLKDKIGTYAQLIKVTVYTYFLVAICGIATNKKILETEKAFTRNWKQGQLSLFVLWIFTSWKFYICKTFPEAGKVILKYVMLFHCKDCGPSGNQQPVEPLLRKFSGPHSTDAVIMPDKQFSFDWINAFFFFFNPVSSSYNTWMEAAL